MAQNNFILKIDYKDIFDDLSDGQAGILIKAIFEYIAAGNVPESLKDRELKMAFRFIRKDLDYNRQRWDEVVEARREAGRTGGKAFYKFDPGIDNGGKMQLYILRMYNNDEDFVKVGVTNLKLNRRFSSCPYRYEIIHQHIGADAIDLEQDYANLLKEYRYEPKIKFGGYLECYNLQSLKIIAQAKEAKEAKEAKGSKIKQNQAKEADSVVVVDVVSDSDVTTTTTDSSASPPSAEDYSAADFEEVKDSVGIPTESAKIVEIWNAFAVQTGLPKVLEISESRKRKLRARLSNERFDIEKIIEAIRGQPALITGLGGRGWRVNFDWLIENDKNYLKVLENNYADGKTIGGRPQDKSRSEVYRRHIENKLREDSNENGY